MNKAQIRKYWTCHEALIVMVYNAIMIVPWFISLFCGNNVEVAIEKLADNGPLLPISFWIYGLCPIALATYLVFYKKREVGCSLKELLELPSLKKLHVAIVNGFSAGLILVLIGMVVLYYWSQFLKSLGIEASSQYLIKVIGSGLISTWQLIGLGFLIVILVPIAEELFYRVIIYGQLREHKNKFVAVLLASAFFAVVHLNLYALPCVFIAGIGFTLVYDQSYKGKGDEASCGRVGIIGSIVAHLTFNLLNFLATICFAK